MFLRPGEIVQKLKDKKYKAVTTEILCVFYPHHYWIQNEKKYKEMIDKLKSLKVLELFNFQIKNYVENYEHIGELQQEILNIMQNNNNLLNTYNELIGRKEINFYDVDGFLFWLIDKKYENTYNEDVLNQEIEKYLKKINLASYFLSEGFYFNPDQITAFYSALKTKGFVILSGLSGTGKTKLAQLFAELLCPCDKCHKKNSQETGIKPDTGCDTCTHIFLSVRPDWRDGKALLGYYNPITENYESTPFLKFILRAKNDYQKNKENANPYFIILDEMNLSHVEYYFSDFLSVLESGRDENGWTKESIKLHSLENVKDLRENEIPSEIKLPPNLYIIGTVNIDETTYMFSPKVLDRAFTLEFREIDFDKYAFSKIDEDGSNRTAKEISQTILQDFKNNGNFCGAIADKTEVEEAIENLKNNGKLTELIKLNNLLQPYDLHFGYRVLNEIALFVKYATNAPDVVGKLDENTALDYAVLMKVLPKFHGPRQKLERPLWLILNWCLKNPVENYENEKFDDFKKKVWKILTGIERIPITDDLAFFIEKFQDKTSKNVYQESTQQDQSTQQKQQLSEEPNQSESPVQQVKQTGQRDAIKYQNAAKKILLMLRQLYETGFASFA